MKCPSCSHDNPPDALFCQNGGRQVILRCSKCGTENTPDARFCKPRGNPLTGSSERLEALQKTAPGAPQEKLRAASADIQGERKPVTILFTDILGSTSLAEKLDP